MQSCGCKPNVITYTIVIKLFCDSGNIREALDSLSTMEREGCKADLITYNVILRELCLQDRVQDIAQLLLLIDQKGFCYDSYTYASLGGSLLKRGKIGIAYKLLSYLISMRFPLDVVVYNIFFHCLCCKNKSKKCIVFIEEYARERLCA